MEQFSPEELQHLAAVTLRQRARTRKYYSENREKCKISQKTYYQKWKSQFPEKYEVAKARALARHHRIKLQHVDSDVDSIS